MHLYCWMARISNAALWSNANTFLADPGQLQVSLGPSSLPRNWTHTEPDLLWRWACQHSRGPRCGGAWGGTAGGSCCWACPGITGIAAWAGQSAASSRAFWGGSGPCWWTCSRGTGTSGTRVQTGTVKRRNMENIKQGWNESSMLRGSAWRGASDQAADWAPPHSNRQIALITYNYTEHHWVLAPTSKCSHLSNTILIFHLIHN